MQLALLSPTTADQRKWFDAVRLIFCEIWFAVGAPTAERVYQPMLEGTWAGSVLYRMKEHHRRLTEQRSQCELANSPEVIQARREEKQWLRQQRHAERLAVKKERDQLWFEKHPRTST